MGTASGAVTGLAARALVELVLLIVEDAAGMAISRPPEVGADTEVAASDASRRCLRAAAILSRVGSCSDSINVEGGGAMASDLGTVSRAPGLEKGCLSDSHAGSSAKTELVL